MDADEDQDQTVPKSTKAKREQCPGRGCPKNFNVNSSGLRKHLKSCQYPRNCQSTSKYEKVGDRFKCSQCLSTFSYRNNLHKHFNLYHIVKKPKKVRESKIFSCVVCSKTFPKLGHLIRHSVTHTRETYDCPKCSKVYRREDFFKKHVESCAGPLIDNQPTMADSLDVDDSTVHVEDFRIDCTFYGPTVQDSLLTENNISVDNTVHQEHTPLADYPVIDVDQIQQEAKVSKTVSRNRSLTTAMENIQRLMPVDQAKIFRTVQNSSAANTLDAIMAIPEIDDVNEAKLIEGLIKHLRSFNLKRNEDKKQFCSILWGICGDSLYNDEFMTWLANKLDKRKHRLAETIHHWLSVTTESLETRGRKGLSQEERQSIFDAWHEYSIVTVDRRNGRDQVTMSKYQYHKKYDLLNLPSYIKLEFATSKRKQEIVRSTRRIATKTFREMQEILKSKFEIDVSLGTIINLRPFYVQPASEREKESCLCKVCLNIRLKYQALMKLVKDDVEVTNSLSEYFGHGIKCPFDANGYFQQKCIAGQCDNKDCSPTSVRYTSDQFNIPNSDNVEYYQFLLEQYKYKCKKTGKEKEGKRTIRQEFKDTFENLKGSLDKSGVSYLNHRFEIKNDQYHWPSILQNDMGYTFHMDYSENISCTPKHEPQDAHFSGKQTSLSCTVVRRPGQRDKECYYAYHLSDDKKHDSVYTISVTRDLLDKFSDYMSFPVLRIKSDNCSTQYCCRYVFKEYSNLSKELNKTIILYYGVNGHGRGLVDAMSGFGVKAPLRRKIVTDDYYFKNAKDLEIFCRNEFAGDSTKLYETFGC